MGRKVPKMLLCVLASGHLPMGVHVDADDFMIVMQLILDYTSHITKISDYVILHKITSVTINSTSLPGARNEYDWIK